MSCGEWDGLYCRCPLRPNFDRLANRVEIVCRIKVGNVREHGACVHLLRKPKRCRPALFFDHQRNQDEGIPFPTTYPMIRLPHVEPTNT